jgi:hypothetical protein
MSDWVRIVGSIVIHQNIRSGQRPESKGLNELTGMPRHRYADVAPGTLKTPQVLDALVGSDSAGDAKRDLSFQDFLITHVSPVEIEM